MYLLNFADMPVTDSAIRYLAQMTNRDVVQLQKGWEYHPKETYYEQSCEAWERMEQFAKGNGWEEGETLIVVPDDALAAVQITFLVKKTVAPASVGMVRCDAGAFRELFWV
jgi:hypothetical protein